MQSLDELFKSALRAASVCSPIARPIALSLLLLVISPSVLCAQEPRFGPLAGADAAVYHDALAKERPTAPQTLRVTGIAIPHHLLAADLIARGMWAASGSSYDRILLLSPDHFRRSRRALATTRRGFDTVLGQVEVDQSATQHLIERKDLVDDSDLFSHEHGITGVLPFLRDVFPGVSVVPVVVGVGTDMHDWDAALDLLKQIVTPHTLIVQSTDYSHYLLPQLSRSRDQETLNVIAVGDPTAVAGLHQSNHLDSKASQYLQMRLQHDVFHSHAAVIANRNSFEYVHENVPSTSYVVTVYAADAAGLSKLTYPDQQTIYFGGDVFLGRLFTVPLLDKAWTNRTVVDGLMRVTNGQPLVVNLEGVLTTHPPLNAPRDRHVMDDALAGPVLSAIHVRAAGLANNHSFDLGPDGLAASARTLAARGIEPLLHGKIADLGGFRLTNLNFVGLGDVKGYPVVRLGRRNGRASRQNDVTHLCTSAALPPLVALVHWGTEYTSSAPNHDREIAEKLAACGVSLVIGAHSHQASPELTSISGGQGLMLYSLGNLLFDQVSPRGSGTILELRIFKQGTFATRLITIANLYEAAAAR